MKRTGPVCIMVQSRSNMMWNGCRRLKYRTLMPSFGPASCGQLSDVVCMVAGGVNSTFCLESGREWGGGQRTEGGDHEKMWSSRSSLFGYDRVTKSFPRHSSPARPFNTPTRQSRRHTTRRPVSRCIGNALMRVGAHYR